MVWEEKPGLLPPECEECAGFVATGGGEAAAPSALGGRRTKGEQGVLYALLGSRGRGTGWRLPFLSYLERLDPDSWTAHVFAGFIGSVALSPLMLQPVLVYAYDITLGYGPDIAGWISSAALAGLAVASLPVAFRTRQWCMGRVSVIGMALMLAFTALTLLVRNPAVLFLLTFIAGLGGGLTQAAVAAALARSRYFGRAFAIFTCFQFVYPGLGALFLLRLLDWKGLGIFGGFDGMQLIQLILIMMGLVMAPLLSVFRLPANVVRRHASPGDASGSMVVARLLSGPVILSLTGMWIYGASNGAVFAYSEGIGRIAGLKPDTIGNVLVGVNLIASVAVLGIIWFGKRASQYIPLIGGIITQLVALAIFFLWPTYNGYRIGMLVFIVAWAIVFQCFLSSQSELDHSGTVVAFGQFTNLVGAALGPSVAAFFIGAEAAFSRALSVSAILTVLALLPMVLVPVLLWREKFFISRQNNLLSG